MKSENSISRNAEKFSMIENWKASGQNQQLFCKENQIAYSNFHYWFKKYKAQQEGSPDEQFLPVKLRKYRLLILGIDCSYKAFFDRFLTLALVFSQDLSSISPASYFLSLLSSSVC